VTENLFGNTAPTTTNASDGAPGLTLGTRIRFAVAGQISGLRWRFPDTLPSGTVQWFVTRYNPADDGTPAGSLGSGTFSTPTAGAYNTVSFAAVSVAAGDEIVAEVWTPDRYVASAHFFDSAVVSGNLTGPADDAVTPRHNGRFATNAAPIWPTGGFNATGYHVDVVFAAAGGATVQGTLDASLGGITAAITGGRRVNASLAGSLGGLVARITGITSGSATPTNPGAGWYKLLSIFRQQDEDARWGAERRANPVACPHCGLVLKSGPEGSGVRLYCPAGDFQLAG
jgi:hypothetical protein